MLTFNFVFLKRDWLNKLKLYNKFYLISNSTRYIKLEVYNIIFILIFYIHISIDQQLENKPE